MNQTLVNQAKQLLGEMRTVTTAEYTIYKLQGDIFVYEIHSDQEYKLEECADWMLKDVNNQLTDFLTNSYATS